MANYTALKTQLRKESGLDFTRERLTARRWVSWLKDHKDNNVKNVGFALAFALKTGRLPNVNFEGKFTNRKTGKPMSNLQVVAAFAKAATNQDENTTAAGCKALQAAFGFRNV